MPGLRRGGKGSENGGPSKKFFLFLLALAGLGAGVWLFRSRRRRDERPMP